PDGAGAAEAEAEAGAGPGAISPERRETGWSPPRTWRPARPRAPIPCPRRLPRKPVAETVGQTAPRGPGPLGAGLAAELARLEAVDPVPGLGRARGRHGAAKAGRRRRRKQAPRKKPDPPLPPRKTAE